MMTKKILSASFAAALIISLAACQNAGGAPGTQQPAPPVTVSPSPDLTPPVESVNPTSPSPSQPEAPGTEAGQVSTDNILAAISGAYGEEFLAIGVIPDDFYESVYGLTPDMYEEITGQMSMISVHPDEVIVVKAKPGMAAQVEEALTAVMERKKNDAVQYPMNIPKTNASRVVANGDYVAYVLLGAPVSDNNADEAARKAHFESEAQKGVDAFLSVFDNA